MNPKTGWDLELELGSEQMDREHGIQISLLGALEQALADGAAGSAAAEILDRLVAYSDVHFGSEELLMRLESYPRYGIHVEEHRRMMDALDEVRARQGRGEDVLERVRDARRWVLAHIEGMDRDFAIHAAMEGAGAGRA
jgi:hemerythrin